MKVLLVGPACSIHLARWANSLAANHEIHIATLHRPEDQQYDPRIQIHIIGRGQVTSYFLAAPKLHRLIERVAPDVIHTHYATGYGTLARFGTIGHDAPRILTVWGADVYDSPELGPHWRYMVRQNLRAAHIITSASHAMARVTKQLAAMRRIDIVPFGVETNLFRPGAGPATGTVTIGTVKTFQRDYGVDILVRAFAAARQRTSVPLHLRLHGNGPDQEELEALVQDLQIEEFVTFGGYLAHQAVPDALRELDIYAALSRTESFGVAIIEAMACGVPVVVSDADGPAEVTPDGVAGIVVPRQDVDAAASAFVRLAEDAALRKSMGQAGREHVLSSYGWEGSVATLNALYDEVVASWRDAKTR